MESPGDRAFFMRPSNSGHQRPRCYNGSMRHLLDIPPDQLLPWLQERGYPAYRGAQIRKWLFQSRVESFEEMSDLPKKLRTELTAEFQLWTSSIATHSVAGDGTEKLLLQLADGNHVECVLMRELERRTVCISTQVGCAMGCVFCASGLLGLKRNLSTAEILEQILRVDRLLSPEERITNVVVMGIGEPLANLRSLVPALETLNDKGGMGIGARRITISTVGLPEKILEMAELNKPYNLAVSLHAPNNQLRNQLVPVNNKIGIEAILKAADEYFERTGRRITYEYVLLGGINDSSQHARQLASLLKDRSAHVNLIPMNDVSELPFHTPALPQTRRFVELLTEAGVKATVRKRNGADIDAACGQLRLQFEAANATTATGH